MSYEVAGEELETDVDGYLVEADTRDEVVEAIAAAEGITLTEDHWNLIRFMQEAFKNDGHTPNFRNLLKAYGAEYPGVDSKALYDLFPMGPAKQAAKVAGLPQPLGKGGY